MLHRSLVSLLAIWAGLSLASPMVAAEPVFPPGLRIGLEPPGDLTVSQRFPGFEDVDRKVAVTILDLPGRAYQDIERSVFAKDQQGLTGLKRESFPIGNGTGILISGHAKDGDVSLRKWLLLATATGGEIRDLTTLISVQVPETATTVYSDAVVRKTLASIRFRPTPIKEQLGLLPFTLNELAGFRVMQVLPAGGVILTEGPADDIGSQPYMIVSIGRGAPSVASDRDRFSRDVLASAPLRALRVQLSEPMRITGGPGHEIRAQAEGPSGNPVSLVQWVRFGGSGYLRIIGVTGKDTWDALFTRFRAVRDGIEFR